MLLHEHESRIVKGICFLSESRSRTMQLLDGADCKTFRPRRSSAVTNL